jgi:hypothetical protein
MVRRHEMGQAICLRPRGLGNTHPMIPIDRSPLLLTAPGPDPPPVTTAIRCQGPSSGDTVLSADPRRRRGSCSAVLGVYYLDG